MIRLFFTHWTLKRALIQLKQLFKGGEDLLARQHKIDWKIYFGLLFIFVPLILLTVFYLLYFTYQVVIKVLDLFGCSSFG